MFFVFLSAWFTSSFQNIFGFSKKSKLRSYSSGTKLNRSGPKCPAYGYVIRGSNPCNLPRKIFLLKTSKWKNWGQTASYRPRKPAIYQVFHAESESEVQNGPTLHLNPVVSISKFLQKFGKHFFFLIFFVTL